MATQRRPGERARDEKRGPGGPRYAGTAWYRSDERAPDERFGHTRADNTAILPGGGNDPAEADPDEASYATPQTARFESGPEQVGIGRAVGTAKQPKRGRAVSRRRR